MKDVYYRKSDLTAETSCNVSGAKFSAIEFKHLASCIAITFISTDFNCL